MFVEGSLSCIGSSAQLPRDPNSAEASSQGSEGGGKGGVRNKVSRMAGNKRDPNRGLPTWLARWLACALTLDRGRRAVWILDSRRF
jgi:hypothetical protein